jgi:hypothetical protein
MFDKILFLFLKYMFHVNSPPLQHAGVIISQKASPIGISLFEACGNYIIIYDEDDTIDIEYRGFFYLISKIL